MRPAGIELGENGTGALWPHGASRLYYLNPWIEGA